jgi:very-short-patch-repair endonuclease
MITLQCEYCRKEYSTQYKYAVKSKRHFCSSECYHQSRCPQSRRHIEQPPKMVTLQCEYCRKEYNIQYHKAVRSKNHFCSLECYHQSNRGEIKKCLSCGKDFYVIRSFKDAKFCSKECVSNYSRIVLTCKQCGKQFEVKKGEAKRGRAFCSYGCSQKYKVGPRVHNYKGNHVTCYCVWCGSEFKKPEAWMKGKRGEGKFCSASCRSRLTVYKQEGMVSSIELMVKDVLEKYEEVYHHQYRIDRFLVDFYLPHRNLVIECDGDYWHSLEKNAKNDLKKNAYMEKAGIALARLKESEIRADCEALILLTLKQYPLKGELS